MYKSILYIDHRSDIYVIYIYVNIYICKYTYTYWLQNMKIFSNCVKLVVSFHYMDDNKKHRLDNVRYVLVAMANIESGWAGQRRKETCMGKEQVVSIFVYTIWPMDILLHQLR